MNDNSFDFSLNPYFFLSENLYNRNDSFSLNLNEDIDPFNEGCSDEKTNLNNKDELCNSNQNIINEIPIKDDLKIDTKTQYKTQETTINTGKNKTQKETKKDLFESKINENAKLLNRKRKNKKEKNSDDEKHSRFSSDNTIRKVKHITLDNVKDFINEKIKEKYNNNIGHGVYTKKLFILNQRQKVEGSKDFNQKFLEKKLSEIFSDRISKKYTNHPEDSNKNLIKNLMNEKDLDKKIYFQKLFNLTFTDCLSHFRGTKKIQELTGLKLFSEYIHEKEKDEDYIEHLDYYVFHFEEMLENKRKRKSKKNSQNANQNKEDLECQEEEVKTIMIDSNC